MTVTIPASIRSHNPGAMWPGPSSEKFNAIASQQLADGEGNHIAIFSSDIDGAAAQFDLLSRAYVGRTVRSALARWSGAEGREDNPQRMAGLDLYCAVVKKDTGLNSSDILTAAYLRNPKTGIAFAKAMARHEAGREYPMTDADWRKAHAMVFAPAPKRILPKLTGRNSVPADDLGLRILKRAQSYLGEHEDDELTKQHIIEWAHLLGRYDVSKNVKFAWCADFIGGLCVLEGAQVPEPSDALLARKYLNVGIRVEPEDAQPGDLCIRSRGQGMGHIGVIETVDLQSRTFIPIAGNSEDEVRREEPWSMDSPSLLGIVRPVPSKLRPNGTKSVPDTISDSPSLAIQINGFLASVGAAIVAGWQWLVDWVYWLIGIAPMTADHVGTVVGSTRRAAENTGVPIMSKVLVVVAITCAATVIYRQVRERRKADGSRRPVERSEFAPETIPTEEVDAPSVDEIVEPAAPHPEPAPPDPDPVEPAKTKRRSRSTRKTSKARSTRRPAKTAAKKTAAKKTKKRA